MAAISLRDRMMAAAERAATRVGLYMLVVGLGVVAFISMIVTAAIGIYPYMGWVGSAGVVATITSLSSIVLCIVAGRLGDPVPPASTREPVERVERRHTQAHPTGAHQAAPAAVAVVAPRVRAEAFPPAGAAQSETAVPHASAPDNSCDEEECEAEGSQGRSPGIPGSWIAAGTAAAIGLAVVVGPVRLFRYAARGFSAYVTLRRLTSSLAENAAPRT